MISCSSAVLSFLFSFLEDAAACFRHLFKKKQHAATSFETCFTKKPRQRVLEHEL